MAKYTDKRIWASECKKRGAVNGLYELTSYPDIQQNKMLLYAVGERNSGLYGVWNPSTGEGTVFKSTITHFDARERKFHKSAIMDA